MHAHRIPGLSSGALGRIGAVLLIAGTLLVARPTASFGAVTCTFDDPTDTVTVALSAGGDSATIARDAAGDIQVNGVDCGAAEIGNTTDIVVRDTSASNNTTVTIDLSGGSLGSEAIDVNLGAGVGDSLIVSGSSGADDIIFGASGVNLDGDGDADVTTIGADNRTANGLGGADELSAGGGSGTGGPLVLEISLNGGAGQRRPHRGHLARHAER